MWMRAGSGPGRGETIGGRRGSGPRARGSWRRHLIDEQAVRVANYLTVRDRQLMRWLHDHQALTQQQITAAVFGSASTARHRLLHLCRMQVLDRFRWQPHIVGGTQPYTYVLGVLGAQLVAAEYAEPIPTPRTTHATVTRIATSPQLRHREGANSVFTALLAHAQHRDRDLWTWLNAGGVERAYDVRNARARCDGHGVWSEGDRTSAFYLEFDGDSEPMQRLLRKIDSYENDMRAGLPRHTVAFVFHGNPAREIRFHRALADLPSTHRAVPIATATTDRIGEDPTRPMWRLPGMPGYRSLIDLPTSQRIADPNNALAGPGKTWRNL